MLTHKIETSCGTLEIWHDENVESPREWSNIGTMVAFHKRYNLGDKSHGYDSSDYAGWQELARAIADDHPDCIMLPLYLYDHSGITISTGSFSCQWDSGQVGFIYVSRETIKSECRNDITDIEVVKYLENEVETYDQYLRGDVYGFTLEGNDLVDGYSHDSCGGFFGDDLRENGMLDHLPSAIHDEIILELYGKSALTARKATVQP